MAEEPDVVSDAPIDRRFFRSKFDAAVIGSIIAVVVAVAQIGTAWYLDARRAEQSRTESQELAWRQVMSSQQAPRLPGAQLDGLNLTGVVATDADITASSAVETVFAEAFLRGARFDGSDLRNADFSGANLVGASFVGADLSGATFADAQIRGAVFSLAGLTDTSFANADIQFADFRDTDVRVSVGTDSFLTRTYCFDDETMLPDGAAPTLNCESVAEFDRTSATGSFSIGLDVRLQGSTPGRWEQSLTLDEAQSVDPKLEFQFRLNNDVAGLLNVSVQAINESGYIDFSDVEIVNSIHPEGSFFEPTAVQGEGSRINIGIGDYLPGANAYVYFSGSFTDLPFDCGRQQLAVTAYMTPEGKGTLNDSTTITTDFGPCDEPPVAISE